MFVVVAVAHVDAFGVQVIEHGVGPGRCSRAGESAHSLIMLKGQPAGWIHLAEEHISQGVATFFSAVECVYDGGHSVCPGGHADGIAGVEDGRPCAD